MARNEIIGWVTGLLFGVALTAGGVIALIESVAFSH
jgi:hypothetical protein